ncbi:MAG: lipopolysaccharide transport periplasmic protein LptA [Pseudoxanthomonas sp.]
MLRIARVELLSAAVLAAAVLAVPTAMAKTSDRQQDMTLDAGYQDGSLQNDGITVLKQGVVMTQGTLEIHADHGEVVRKGGEVVSATFYGSPVTMQQQQDDGTMMTGHSDRLDYDFANNLATLTGNYTVTSPKGSNSGQKMVYNTNTGNMQSGGDGTRVHTVIKPKNPAPAAPAKPGGN